LLRRNPDLTARRREVATASIEGVLATALGDHTPADLAEVLNALETLGSRLNPEAITRLRAEAGGLDAEVV
jgi:hypothetical protein